jgi:hypothetical protein
VSIRRLIVVVSGAKSCLCLGIHNYHGNGCVQEPRQDLHTIIYATKQPPLPITITITDPETKERRDVSEKFMVNKPISITAAHPSILLQPASRINYARIHQVDFNVRVKSVGLVNVESIQDLSDQFDDARRKLLEVALSPILPQGDTTGSDALVLPQYDYPWPGEGDSMSDFPEYQWSCCQCDNTISTRYGDCCVLPNCRHAKCPLCIVIGEFSKRKVENVQVAETKELDGILGDQISLPPLAISKLTTETTVQEMASELDATTNKISG